MPALADADRDRWEIDATGVLSAARQVVSPNCDERPPGSRIELIVIHNISLPPGCFQGEAIAAFFTNCLDPAADPYFREIASLTVSAHFLIRRDGELVQFVPCRLRAWHAGASRWRGRDRCNDFSIGIELEGSDDIPFEEAQYARLASLIDVLRDTYPIEDCVGHQDIAVPPGRKTDPGPHFEWARLGPFGRSTGTKV
ncbi:MAG: 1,6-anhydro-N-acetylmuramyl-L-alanine amidase AmpD [Burkholderiales bacterium]